MVRTAQTLLELRDMAMAAGLGVQCLGSWAWDTPADFRIWHEKSETMLVGPGQDLAIFFHPQRPRPDFGTLRVTAENGWRRLEPAPLESVDAFIVSPSSADFRGLEYHFPEIRYFSVPRPAVEGGPSYVVTLEKRDGCRYSFPLGPNHGYSGRKPGAVTLEAQVVSTAPFRVEFDLDPDGSWRLRNVNCLPGPGPWHVCPYVGFVPGLPRPKTPTPAQAKTLARWCFNDWERPYAAGVGLSAPLTSWGFQGLSIEDVENLGNAGRKSYYTEPRARMRWDSLETDEGAAPR